MVVTLVLVQLALGLTLLVLGRMVLVTGGGSEKQKESSNFCSFDGQYIHVRAHLRSPDIKR